jgi:hypothetical protein
MPSMSRFHLVLFSGLAFALGTFVDSPAAAQSPLNDTGLDTCFNDSGSTGTTEPGSHPRQDCRFGRDAAAASGALGKVGAGGKGFDFTKIGNDGSVLAAGASLGTNPTDWACTLDNVTGLVWEVKTTSGLRNAANTYSWFSADPFFDNGFAGIQNGGSCGGVGCDTAAFTAAVNGLGGGTGLCGHHDWRVPSVQELKSLVDFGRSGAGSAIDPGSFPNTLAGWTWTNNGTRIGVPGEAWAIHFGLGGTGSAGKGSSYSVRLVRP